MTHRYTAGANVDQLQLVAFYEARQPGLGGDFDAEVDATIVRILAHPHAGAPVAGAPPGREVRKTPTRRFPVVITYEVAVILSLVHARSVRRPWRQRLPDPP
jgi:plasmid stabilization system protein ParE